MQNDALTAIFDRHWSAILQADQKILPLISSWPEESKKQFFSQFQQVLISSDFVVHTWCALPEKINVLIEKKILWQKIDRARIQQELAIISAAPSEQELLQLLRQYRNIAMVRIIWRMITKESDLEETLADLTALADESIDLCVRYYIKAYQAEWGLAYAENGQPMSLVVLGLGKLGASELNLSSDVDLVFAFETDGVTQEGRLKLEHSAYFIRLGQKIIHALNQITADGFVFRVDMRLRPYGQSGALALSFDAMENYYEQQGREWERYAFIKARIVAGDQIAGAQLLKNLKPFVYRRYIDYGVYASLRAMKQLIQMEVQRKGIETDIKVGAGGIREIEFFAQVFQLLRGGREPQLQSNHLLTTLAVLEKIQLIPPAVHQSLREAYIFLRHLEHRLQAINDQQTQSLPSDGLIQLRVAYAMGFDSWSALQVVLDHHRQQVSEQFQQIIQPVKEETPIELANADQHEKVQQFLESRLIQQLHPVGRERLDKLMPRLLTQVMQHVQAEIILPRVLTLLEAIVRRSAYLALLNENPRALDLVIELCAASPWVAEQLTQKPVLLDDLLSRPLLSAAPDLLSLKTAAHQELSSVVKNDLEAFMEALRHFKNAQVMQIIVAEIQQTLPLMKVSDALTWTAEAILSEALAQVWRETLERWGGDVDSEPDLIIVAYGKLGGLELGPDSDLDLVFIHPEKLAVKLEKPVEPEVFYTRIVQRLIHVLTAHTASGTLYEVDLRLRPSGASGLLVTHAEAFRHYQQHSAWTWEHQALVRARVVAGSTVLANWFNQLRKEVLMQKRAEPQLRQQVVDMRVKMRQHFGPVAAGQFDLKQGQGGIVDLEFLVQFAVLNWAQQYPELTTYTDNIRILESLAQVKLLSAEIAQALRETYISYRAMGHRLTLQNQPLQVSDEYFVQERAQVNQLWQVWLKN